MPKRASRKVSKRVSRKGSKRVSRKVSKRVSRKGSKRVSRKGSKRASRKVSKRVSQKSNTGVKGGRAKRDPLKGSQDLYDIKSGLHGHMKYISDRIRVYHPIVGKPKVRVALFKKQINDAENAKYYEKCTQYKKECSELFDKLFPEIKHLSPHQRKQLKDEFLSSFKRFIPIYKPNIDKIMKELKKQYIKNLPK